MRAEDFIIEVRIPDIQYSTKGPSEIVSPRVTWIDSVPMVYGYTARDAGHKHHIPVEAFFQMLASGHSGLMVTGYRASNGRQTTISFNRMDGVAVSARLEAFLSELRSNGPLASTGDEATRHTVLDPEAQRFLEEFEAPSNPQLAYWLPKYAKTLERVREAISRNAPEELFDTIWKSRDNSVSNAGQGVMGFQTADRLHDELVDVIMSISADGSPENFDVMVNRMEKWRAEGRLPSVPRLLLARAFAAIHPQRYHTTVDTAKQERIIPWFEKHTGFSAPEGNWATRAEALCAHLERIADFGNDVERRNIFPWFVFVQMHDASGRVPFRPGHTSKPTTGIARGSAEARQISYRHNVIQDRLIATLIARHGSEFVASEHPTGTGGFADALVKHTDGKYDLYEIKPAETAASAVRQAMGQLLEYAFRAGGLEPASLHVVSDAALDETTSAFLTRLRDEYGLPIAYLQVDSTLGDT